MKTKIFSNRQGFTLIEVMVAVLVVALAISALLVQMMSYTDSAAYLRDKVIAQWVALNQLELERMTNQISNRLPNGVKTGAQEMAYRDWYWQITPKKTAADGFVLLEVAVFEGEEDKDPLITIEGYVDQYHRR